MRTFKLFLIWAVTSCFIQSCGNKHETVMSQQGAKKVDTINLGCLGTYELDFQGNGDTINKAFGKDHVKYGRWVTYLMTLEKEKTTTGKAKSIRIKTEEGYYRNNKKEGFWKFYNKNGTFKDSIEYKDDVAVINPKSLIDKLFIHSESIDSSFCDQLPNDNECEFGALYFTKKGNVIFNSTNENSDTVSYFWGTYITTGTKVTFTLADEFYYRGRWDARWDGANPDFKKGKTRKVNPKEVTLFKTKCDTASFYQSYTKHEKAQAVKSHKRIIPIGRIYFPYYETKEMKFYRWFYKQVPVLAKL